MKIIFALIISLTLLLPAYSQDSTVAKEYARLICECTGQIGEQVPGDSINKEINLCISLSLAGILNKQLINQEFLGDKEKMTSLSKTVASLLKSNCTSFNNLKKKVPKPPVFRAENPDNIFIPASFYSTYGMSAGENNTRLHVFNMDKTTGKYQRAVDIRWVFETKEDAVRWHRINMKTNSEEGEAVKESFVIENVSELAIFRESAATQEMMKALGISQRHHYFLFVVENVVCKVFVATDNTLDTKDALPFAVAAAKQVKSNMPQ